MATGYVYDERALLHSDPEKSGHPERASRIEAIKKRLEASGLLAQCVHVKCPQAPASGVGPLASLEPWIRSALCTAHTHDHTTWLSESIPLDTIECAAFSKALDSLYVCPDSAISACAAAEATVRLACAIASSNPRVSSAAQLYDWQSVEEDTKLTVERNPSNYGTPKKRSFSRISEFDGSSKLFDAHVKKLVSDSAALVHNESLEIGTRPVRSITPAGLRPLSQASPIKTGAQQSSFTEEKIAAVEKYNVNATLPATTKLHVSDQAMVRNGFAIVRPPGHHAESDRGMGFCLLNNVAVAVHALMQRRLARKVLIVDWDVHHGNGTQQIFQDDPNVLLISIHRFDRGTFYPCDPVAAAPSFVGTGLGKGYTVNVAWNIAKDSATGATDADYIAAFENVIMPMGRAFCPDVVIVSAGFDAAEGDPIGGCSVTPSGFARMTYMLSELAGGRIMLVLEGGYRRSVIAECAEACLQVLLHGASGLESVMAAEADGEWLDDDSSGKFSANLNGESSALHTNYTTSMQRDFSETRSGRSLSTGPSPMALAAISETLRHHADYWAFIRPRPVHFNLSQHDSKSSIHPFHAVTASHWKIMCRDRWKLVPYTLSILGTLEALSCETMTKSYSPYNYGRYANTALAYNNRDSVSGIELEAQLKAFHTLDCSIHVSQSISDALKFKKFAVENISADGVATNRHSNNSLSQSQRSKMPATILVFAHENGHVYNQGGLYATDLVDPQRCCMHTPIAPLIDVALSSSVNIGSGNASSLQAQSNLTANEGNDINLAFNNWASSAQPAVIDVCVRARKWRLKQTHASASPSELDFLNHLFLELWDEVLSKPGVDRVFFISSGLPSYPLVHLFEKRFLSFAGGLNNGPSVQKLVSGTVIISPTMFIPVAHDTIGQWYQSKSLVLVPTSKPAGQPIASTLSFGTCVSLGTDDPNTVGVAILSHIKRILSFLLANMK